MRRLGEPLIGINVYRIVESSIETKAEKFFYVERVNAKDIKKEAKKIRR